MNGLMAGASQLDISPLDSQFLYGYPHVERYSTGIHDTLMSSALYLANPHAGSEVMFIANDIIHVSRQMTADIRTGIAAGTGMKPESIMVTATHTHSGPRTVDRFSVRKDSVVPPADPKYVRFLLAQAVKSGLSAHRNAQPAKLGLAVADVSGIGTNRRDPAGPADLESPVLMVKTRDDRNIACMLVCSMHPTVLHEDSRLVSADFPGMARLYLQNRGLGKDCPVLYHTGPAGNQSPRHVVRSNTFEEAERLGNILGKAVERTLECIEFTDAVELDTRRVLLDDIPRRTFPGVEEAEAQLKCAVDKLESLRAAKAPKQEIRTTECDWFGAEARVHLARAAANGLLKKDYDSRLPAEIQLLRIGSWNFVGWPAEIFVEYALNVKKERSDTYIIAYANGELCGYIVTKEAYEEGGYEAAGGLFGWETGKLFVEKTLALLEGR